MAWGDDEVCADALGCNDNVIGVRCVLLLVCWLVYYHPATLMIRIHDKRYILNYEAISKASQR